MSSKSKNIVRTQYVYVNSKNVPGSMPYDISLDIPRGLLQCDDQTQNFKVSVQSFQMTRSWYFVNSTNNQFALSFGGGQETIFTIPEGNYSYKQLASAIAVLISTSSIFGKEQITVIWDSKTNKLIFTFPFYLYALNFNLSNSAAYVMGFDPIQYTPNTTSLQIISTYILPSTLSKSLCLYVDLSPSKGCLSLENKSGSTCEPVTSILNLPNDVAPFDSFSFDSQSDQYAITVAEKSISTLRLSIRNEDGVVLKYVSDYRAVLKFEILQDDTSYDNQIALLQEIKEMREYLKYIFLQKNL